MIIHKRNLIDYSLIVLFIASSGFSYFMSSTIIKVLLFILLFAFFVLRKKVLNLSFLFFILLLFTITLLQALKFQFLPVVTVMGLLIMVISAYLIVKILEDKFILYYINILYYLAIVSLIIYFSMILVPPMKTLYAHITPIFHIFNFSHTPHETILIYNFGIHPERFHLRNSGPFWEPGAFSGYLIVAYIFNFIKVPEIKDQKNLVLLITIITTLSTTGFVALFVFFSFVYFKKIKNFLLKTGSIITIIAIGVFAYNTFDFLGEKINEQLEYAQKKGIENSSNSQRFLSILRDIHFLKKHELIGRGGHDLTRYDIRPGGDFVISTVGLTDIIVRYGIPMFFLILYFLYTSIGVYLKNIKEKNQLYCSGILITILLTLFSEVYFTYPMYWGLVFLKFAYSVEEEEELKYEHEKL